MDEFLNQMNQQNKIEHTKYTQNLWYTTKPAYLHPNTQPQIQNFNQQQLGPYQQQAYIQYQQLVQCQQFPQPVYQPVQQPVQRRQVYITPDEAEEVIISKVVIDPEKKFQIYIGNLPRGVADAEMRDAFRGCGDIKNVHITERGYGFVNFTRKEGAMNALMQHDFIIRGQKVALAGFHQKLQIILRRIPPKALDEIRFQACITKYLHQRHPGLFCFAQIQAAKFGCSAYLHFLSKEDSINAFETLKTTDFTKFAIRELQIVSNLDSAKIVPNEEVERRQASGENPNQDLDSEVLQFLCLRYVEKSGGQPQQQAIQQPVYQQQVQNNYDSQQSMQHAIPVQQAQPQRNNNMNVNATSVYLKMMSMGTNDQQVTQSMIQFGSVTKITMINDKAQHMGMSPCAIVFFGQPEYADAALRSGQVMINGVQVNVTPHVKKMCEMLIILFINNIISPIIDMYDIQQYEIQILIFTFQNCQWLRQRIECRQLVQRIKWVKTHYEVDNKQEVLIQYLLFIVYINTINIFSKLEMVFSQIKNNKFQQIREMDCMHINILYNNCIFTLKTSIRKFSEWCLCPGP
ncbi:RNA_recognition motif-containing protein [Hexamita inflata]|uniref:RNA_recognition motif-containing protein n=1 Tax=Hexamita inflata TaxID=28002 RepID=A0ABP1KW02_9EUKA